MSPNQPRLSNPHRSVRVEDDLWLPAEDACAELDTTRAEVMRQSLRDAIRAAEAKRQSVPT